MDNLSLDRIKNINRTINKVDIINQIESSLKSILPIVITLIILVVIILLAIMIAKFTIGTIFKTSSAFLIISLLNTFIVSKFDFNKESLLYTILVYVANKFMIFAKIGFISFYIATLIKYIVQKRLIASLSWIILGLIIITIKILIL